MSEQTRGGAPGGLSCIPITECSATIRMKIVNRRTVKRVAQKIAARRTHCWVGTRAKNRTLRIVERV